MKKEKVRKYKIIGMMSGTSLDGLDVAVCNFYLARKKWIFSIEAAKTYPYPATWKNHLATAHMLPAAELQALHARYGAWLGTRANEFIRQHSLQHVDLIASHGHTVFHQPERGFTFQLGDGNALHATTGLPVAFDFRSLDVVRGGEGAPLVPLGDQLLFPDFDACLNLGGIANISMDVRGVRKAFDICFCNMALNYLSAKAGKSFDKNGALARQGRVHPRLLERLQRLYRAPGNRRPSLGREGFENTLQILLDDDAITIPDKLHTVCASVAHEVRRALPASLRGRLLATGGGALNSFLIESIQSELPPAVQLVVPEKVVVNFKEALIFAFLGLRRTRGEINVLKSVTGAQRDSCAGVLIG